MSASLYEFRDLDLMMAVKGGGVTSAELADTIGVGPKGVQGVAVRASWMRRFGMFDYDDKQGVWTLSGGGARVVESKRQAAALTTVERVPDEAMVDVMAHVTARYRLGDPMMAALLRREFMFGTSAKSRVWRG